MTDNRPDPFEVIGELIANTIETARVFGENSRISHLVAGSVSRFMTEMEDGDVLLSHALGCVGAEDEVHVPGLKASLQVLSAERT